MTIPIQDQVYCVDSNSLFSYVVIVRNSTRFTLYLTRCTIWARYVHLSTQLYTYTTRDRAS
jgi:hypothetical protein